MRALVVLEDGFHLEGESFAGEGEVCAEVVFHTEQIGYQEVLTDPASYGRAVVFTNPVVGNYGIGGEDSQSARIAPRAVIVREYTPQPSNYRATESLSTWLAASSVLGVHQIDTRALVLHLREHGPKKAIVTTQGGDIDELARRAAESPNPTEQELISLGTREPYTYHEGGQRRVAVLDCGVRQSFLSQLAALGSSVRVLPPTTPVQQIVAEKPDVVVLAGGPDEPFALTSVLTTIKELLGRLPIVGVGLGHILIGQAFGLEVHRLQVGHRGTGHPVRELDTGSVILTGQNHGYALAVPGSGDEFTVEGPVGPVGLFVTHRSLFDGTVEGLAAPTLQVYTVQFNPEGSFAPRSTTYIARLLERIGDDA